MTGYICSSPLYEYEYEGKVWLIELPRMTGGPCVLKSNGEPYERVPAGGWDALNAFFHESDREKYRIGGGCEVI